MNCLDIDERRERAFSRVAWVLRDFWECHRSGHTRIFDLLMHHDQDLIYMGRSVNGGGHKEHLVPCVMLVSQAFHMYEHGLELSEVASLMRKYLRVADITKEEARHLDYDCKMKTRMPADWNFETGVVTARLDLAGIKLVHDGQA